MGPLMRMKTHNINSLVLRSRPDPRVRRKAPLTTPEGYAHPFPPPWGRVHGSHGGAAPCRETEAGSYNPIHKEPMRYVW